MPLSPLFPKAKITRIEMDWTDAGARCFSTRPGFACPRCNADLVADQEHRCGNMAPGPPNLRAKRKAAK